jgi:integrase/recombinase XerD
MADESLESLMSRPSAKNARPLTEAMREVIRALRSENASPSTIEGYREKWGPFFAYLDARVDGCPTVADFTLEHGRDYIIYRLHPEDGRRPLSPVSGGTHVRTLRAISGWFRREGLTGEHRFARLGVPKLDVEPEGRVLSTDERLALFASARGMSSTARRNVAILAVLDDVGPRVSELVTLDREDLRLDDRSILLRHPAKRGVVRTLPLGSESVRIIRDLVGTRRTSGPLFVQRGGARMTDDAVRAMLVRLSAMTGVERVSPHDFRHTASTNYSANGADEALKNKVFGWKPDRRSMNQRYTHLTPEQVVAAHQRLSPLDQLAPFRRSRAA